MNATSITTIASRERDGTASDQWANRPDDERFLTLESLAAHVGARKAASFQQGLALEHTKVYSDDSRGVCLTDGSRFDSRLSHWSFGQLATRAKAPAGYLRQLPAELAAINLQWGLEHNTEDARALIHSPSGGDSQVQAVTSDSYGRIWDADVINALRNNLGPEWKVPSASYASRDAKRATTLYASDHDVFVFLVNESNPIEVAGESLFRGFYLSNSETGAAALRLSTFLYRYVCDNRNIWGQKDFRELKIRHSSGAPQRMVREVQPQIRAYLTSGTDAEVAMVKGAMARDIGKDKDSVTSWLKTRGFNAKLASKAYDSAERDGLNPRTLWGVVQGLTDAAHDVTHTDDRVSIERKAGELLDLA